MVTKLLLAITLACTTCGGTPPAPQPEPETCPAECAVQWSERHWQTYATGKTISGSWRYLDHEVCDDRCRYRGEPPTCNVQLEPVRTRARPIVEAAADGDRP